MPDPAIRELGAADLAAVLTHNNAEVPAVGRLDRERLADLVAMAESALAAEVEGALAGFVLALPPGTPYDSPNYHWFAARYEQFVYVDRIVVLPHSRRQSVARALYDQVVARTAAPVLAAEVNVRPRNEASLSFHERYGFETVGRTTPYDGIEVAMLARDLA